LSNIITGKSTKKKLIVIISDDDEGHTFLIKKNLNRVGIKKNILSFKDGEETLQYFHKSKKNNLKSKNYLLLLDIRMPKINGIEVLQKMKNDQKLSNIPIIIVTTTDDPKEVDLCTKLGCVDYITKPIDHEKFTKIIFNLGII
jgi:CheY-like chemotaxis protein